ncbi:MAG TPA: cation transporter [Chitinophagaceae bacterium]|jgi:copper chaperone CopZ|nr:cation transporter [Chitinophagaceae bacterium]
MKRLFFSAFILLGITLTSSAQTKALQTVKISTPTIQCEMCKNKIETYLKRYDGVNMITVNVKKKETSVKYITDRINEEEIKTAIANAGYDAGDVAANPDSYKKLPICCKKPDDGGGMKKN